MDILILPGSVDVALSSDHIDDGLCDQILVLKFGRLYMQWRGWSCFSPFTSTFEVTQVIASTSKFKIFVQYHV